MSCNGVSTEYYSVSNIQDHNLGNYLKGPIDFGLQTLPKKTPQGQNTWRLSKDFSKRLSKDFHAVYSVIELKSLPNTQLSQKTFCIFVAIYKYYIKISLHGDQNIFTRTDILV